MKTKPIGYRVLLEPEKVEEKVGNILMPDEVRDQKQFRQSRGVIVAMGDLAFTKGNPKGAEYLVLSPRPKVGDTVLYREYAGYAFKDEEGNPFTMVDDDEIMAVIEND